MKLREFHKRVEQGDPRHLRGVKYRFALILFLSLLTVAAAMVKDFEIPRLFIFLLILIAAAYNTLIYIWIAWGKGLEYRVYFAAPLDFFLLTIAVHYLGGVEATVFWMYALGIIAYASIHGLRMGLYTAAISSLMHSSLLVGEFSGAIEHISFGFLNPVHINEGKLYLSLRLLSDNFLFFLAALMSGLISEQLIRSKKELEERNERLGLEIAEREQIEEELRKHREGLEKLVAESTSELATTVNRLQSEITERGHTEERLRSSEDRLRILFEYAPDAYYISNLEGVFIDGNKAAEDLIGQPRNELIGKLFTDFDLLAPDQIARAASILAQNAERIPTGPDELTLSMKDDHNVVVELRTYPIEIRNQSLVLNIARDVTERKRAGKALEESEKRYRSLVDNLLSGICILQDGEVKFVNQWLLDKSGYTREEFVGQPIEKFIHPDDLQLSAEVIARRYEGDISPRPPMRVITKSGTVYWTEALGTIIEYEGRPAILSNLTDITDRMQAERTLKESEQRYRSVVERVLDMIVTIDAETGGLTSANDYTEELLGYSREELLDANSFLEFIHPDDRERMATAFGDQFQKGIASTLLPFRILKKDGNFIHVEERGSVLRDDHGKPFLYLGVMRDITERMKADAALWASEENYRLHFENVNDVIFSIDRESRMTSISPSVEIILGYKPEELTGQTIAELAIIAPESRERISQGIGEVFSGAHVEMLEYEFLAKDGSKKLGELNVAPRKKDGEVVELICVARDITDRRQAEESLRQSEEMYRGLFEDSIEGIFTQDIEGNYTSCNQAMAEIVGYPLEKIIGSDYRKFMAPEAWEKAFQDFNRMFRTGEPIRNLQYDIVRPDGERRTVESNASPIKKHDRIVGFQVTARDITERKHADEILRESEEKYRTLFEESKDGVFITGADGQLKEINPSGLELFGFSSKEELAKVPLKDIHVNAGQGKMYQDTMATQGFVKDMELNIIRKDGEQRNVLVTATAVRDEDENIVAFRGIIRDMTERNQLQQQLFQSQKMESIGTLAGGIAHDFNNILGGILGYASLMKAKMEQGHRFFNYVDTIETGSMRAAQLTDQLLAFARGGKYDIKPVDLNKIIHETLKIINRTFDKSIEVETHLHDRLPTVEADAGQIQQVIMNLCINAGDAMPVGGTLTIQTEVETLDEGYVGMHMGAKAGAHAILSISDTGVGMDPKTAQRIFEPFFSTKGEGKGTGLGLAMVYGVVKNHGGFVDVSSEPGRGTTFNIFLPLSGKPESEASSEPEPVFDGNELVLVVDDEEPIRALAKEMLEGYGYRVILAEDGVKAIEMFEEHNGNIGLVILDMVMPNMGGRETFLKMKKINPNVKALLSTGYSQSGKAQEILDSGVLGFVQKPYQLTTLLSKVRSVLDA
jgi:PAS domain S-box-containing protein